MARTGQRQENPFDGGEGVEPLVAAQSVPIGLESLGAALPTFDDGDDDVPLTTSPAGEIVAGDTEGEEDGTVEIHVLSKDGTDYELKRLPVKEALIITAGMMKDSSEGAPGERLTSEYYDQRFAYYWTSQDPNHPSSMAAHRMGYRPCTDADAARIAGHSTKKIDGYPKPVVSYGDMILVRAPRAVVEARKAEEQEFLKRRFHDNVNDGGRKHLEGVYDRMGADGKVVDGFEVNGQRVEAPGYVANADQSFMAGVGSDGIVTTDRSMMVAESVQRAMEYQEREDKRMPGGASNMFGGFQGRPGFNGAVPESPFFRAAAVLAAQSGLKK